MAAVWRCLIIGVLFLNTCTVPHGKLDLYVQEKATVQFAIPKQERRFLILDWIYNTEHVVVSYNHKHKDVMEKLWDNVEFNMETFALTLKNIQKNQSGEYVAKIHRSSTYQIVARYRIFAQGPVESPVLTAVSEHSGSDYCNMTVACRGHDLSLQSSCNNQTCFPQSATSSAMSRLTVSVKSGMVVCNHSNQVSWKNVTEKIDLLCHPSEDNMEHDVEEGANRVGIPGILVIVIVFSLLVITVCFSILLWDFNRTKSINLASIKSKEKLTQDESVSTAQNQYIMLPWRRHRVQADVRDADRDFSDGAPDSKTTWYSHEGDYSVVLPVTDSDNTSEKETIDTASMHLYSNSEYDCVNSIYSNIHTKCTSYTSVKDNMVQKYIKEDIDDSIYMNTGLVRDIREGEPESVDDCVTTGEDDISGAYGSTVESENIYANQDTVCL